MKPQPKKEILESLKNIYPSWKSGAEIEDIDWGGKKSCSGRALRRLFTEGNLEREYRPLVNRHDNQVFYRYKPYSLPLQSDTGQAEKKEDTLSNGYNSNKPIFTL